MRMFDFAEKTSNMSAIEILNYYRSLYSADPYGTEGDIVANAIKDVLCIINSQKEEIEQWQEEVNRWQTLFCQRIDDREEIEAEAYKEFAKRLKEKSFQSFGNYGITRDVVEVCDIDNLVKEMVGENNA